MLILVHIAKDKFNHFSGVLLKVDILTKKLNVFRQRYFCSKECYEDYKKDFVVEVYNEQPVYCVEIDGEKRYMPYFEANYYFTTIDDCKKRMDMNGVAVVNKDMFRLMQSLS